MTQPMLYMLGAAVIFGIAVYGLLSRPHLVRRLLSLNMMGVSIFLLLIAFARRDPAAVDPVPHAMVLTGIVIAVSTTAFGLALARRIYRDTGRVALGEDHDE